MAGKYACMQAETWRKQTSRYKIAPAKELNAKRSSNMAPSFIGEDGDASQSPELAFELWRDGLPLNPEPYIFGKGR
jgi:hypothetical protein